MLMEYLGYIYGIFHFTSKDLSNWSLLKIDDVSFF